jgi:hypothetical protein
LTLQKPTRRSGKRATWLLVQSFSAFTLSYSSGAVFARRDNGRAEQGLMVVGERRLLCVAATHEDDTQQNKRQ